MCLHQVKSNGTAPKSTAPTKNYLAIGDSSSVWMPTRKAVEEVYRSDWGRIVATLIGLVGDFDLAEEAAQEAFTAAVDQWRVVRRAGVPAGVDHPDGAAQGDRPDSAAGAVGRRAWMPRGRRPGPRHRRAGLRRRAKFPTIGCG